MPVGDDTDAIVDSVGTIILSDLLTNILLARITQCALEVSAVSTSTHNCMHNEYHVNINRSQLSIHYSC